MRCAPWSRKAARNIIVTFVLERDIGEASEDVREKVAGDAQAAAERAAADGCQSRSGQRSRHHTGRQRRRDRVRELTEIADKQIRRALETVDGVGGVDISGGRTARSTSFMDLDKLNAYNLSAQDVQQAIQTENIETPGGRIVRGPTELGVRTMGRVERSTSSATSSSRTWAARRSVFATSATPKTAWRRSGRSPTTRASPP